MPKSLPITRDERRQLRISDGTWAMVMAQLDALRPELRAAVGLPDPEEFEPIRQACRQAVADFPDAVEAPPLPVPRTLGDAEIATAAPAAKPSEEPSHHPNS